MKSSPTFWKWITPQESSGQRADSAIQQALQSGAGTWGSGTEQEIQRELSRSQIQRLMDEGKVTVQGKPLKANTKLAPDWEVTVEVPAPKSLEIVPEDRPIEVLYEDDQIVVVNKPPGLTVHPSTTQTEGTLVHALLHHIKDLSGIGGVMRPGIVHRIDKDTSGALVITKTDAAHQALAKTFSKHEIERRYWAIVYGTLPTEHRQKEFKIESLIGRNPTDRKKMSMTVQEGRRAVTFVRLLEEYAEPRAKAFASLVEARLETGRTHQVRVHLTGSEHSLLGDPVYGLPSEKHTKWQALPREIRERVTALQGQALHARVLGFEHPTTGKPLRFEAEPPEAFRLLLESLRRYR